MSGSVLPPLKLLHEDVEAVAWGVLPLDDPRWSTLPTAYDHPGLPTLLNRLLTEPPEPEPGTQIPTIWEEVWELILYQGCLYPAAMAAMPYLVLALARVEPARRTFWLGSLAELEALRAVQPWSPDAAEWLTTELLAAYERALRDVVSLVAETILAATQPLVLGETSEEETARLLSLLAFARGERRLGYLLARWWPYADSASGLQLPVAGLTLFEDSNPEGGGHSSPL